MSIRISGAELRDTAALSERLDPTFVAHFTIERDTRGTLLLSQEGGGRRYPVSLDASRESMMRERERSA